MNLHLSHQMTTALTSHHKSSKSGSENDTIKSSNYKGLGEVRVEKQAIFEA